MNRDQAQADRRQRGEDFQAELRRSWRLLPNCVRLRIADGANQAGTRPADELVLLQSINVLCEAKRTAGTAFTLNMVRAGQQKGLLSFDQALPRNRGLIFISFQSEPDGRDEAYAFRFIDALRRMRDFKVQYIDLEDFRLGAQGGLRCVPLPPLTVDGERAYDLKGVEQCYR